VAAVVTAGSLLLPNRTTRLAVLPIENVSGEAAVALGLTDEMTTRLGTVYPGRLAVLGRTSATRYAAGKAGLAELGVDYLIEGSLRTEGGQSRIAVRLVEARKQTQVWSNTFQLAGMTALELQTDVAQRVAAAVVRQLFPKSAPWVGRSYEPNAQAAEAYWNGRYLDRRDPSRGIAWFTQAAALDPNFAAPRAAMAETWLGQAMSGPPAQAGEAFAKAGAAAREALAIDKWNAEAHAALGTVLFWYEWKAADARRHFEEAIERNPSLARAHHDYAFLLVEMGEASVGIAELRTALALDPVAPRVNLDAGWVFLQARRFDDAVRYARRAMELEPRLEEARLCIARAELYQGKSGPEELERLRASANPYYRAMGAAMTGRADEAIAALNAALGQRSSMMAMIGTEPAFNRLRKDARFVAMVKKVGITP
jgi:TolB-like protein